MAHLDPTVRTGKPPNAVPQLARGRHCKKSASLEHSLEIRARSESPEIATEEGSP